MKVIDIVAAGFLFTVFLIDAFFYAFFAAGEPTEIRGQVFVGVVSSVFVAVLLFAAASSVAFFCFRFVPYASAVACGYAAFAYIFHELRARQ